MNEIIVKTIMRPLVVINDNIISVGTKVHYAYRDHISNDNENWETCYDEGDGIVTDVGEDVIAIDYRGGHCDMRVWVNINDILSGFHKIDII